MARGQMEKKEVTPAVSTTILHSVNRNVISEQKVQDRQLYYSTFALSRLWRRICLRARRLFSIPSGMGRQQAEAEAKGREEVKDI